MNKKLNKLIDSFFNTRAAAVYLLLFAVVVGAATFIENDYGTPAAQKVVYKQRWFELLLIFFCISLVYNIVKYKFIKQKKWANLAFHLAMVIIIIGAGITRYFGYEGMMHIREGSSNDYFLSSDTYLNFEVEHNGNHFDFSEPVLFAGIGNNSFKENYSIGGGVLEVALQDVIPNPANVLEESEDGKPIIKVVFGGSNGRSEYFLVFGESKEIGGVLFNFSNDELPGAFNISLQN
ncbi:MAG: cytochrome c biogenesis protein ResB, partial [Bacteroidia bacterium]